MSIPKRILLALCAYEAAATVAEIGKPRDPVTQTEVVVHVAIWAAFAGLVTFA